MPNYFYVFKSLLKGKTLVRILLEYRLKKNELTGEVIDLGSGNPNQYTGFIKRAPGTNINFFDQKIGNPVDFEKDLLPLNDKFYDVVIFLNVLEHIYNYKHILKEIKRIKKVDGTLVFFVPFLKWYHADPNDYFRYTHQALEKIFIETEYRDIKIEPLYLGPYSTAFDMILPTLPRIIRPFVYWPNHILDVFFRKLRPAGAQRYILGYYLEAK